MNQEQAISVLITGVRIAQGKGAFSLEESAIILDAIKVFSPKQEIKEEEKTEKEEKPLDK